MPSGFDGAYAYARVCGSLARSFLGEKATALAMSARVGEAWRALFGESPPALSEAELATAAEHRLRTRAMDALGNIAGSLLRDEPFFAALLRKWEFTYLKAVLAAMVERSPAAPSLTYGCSAPGFDARAYPDLGMMLKKTRYHWLIAFGLDDLPAVKNRLDRQYYSELWDSLSTIPSGLEGTIPHLLRLEAELQNMVWSLRLKRYHSMGAADIEPLLIAFDGVDVRTPALRAVGLRFDSRQDWQGWKWERLVPDSRREDGGAWFFDVRGFELAAHEHLRCLLHRRLHLEGETYVPLYAYFRIKEFETTAIQGIIEGIMMAARTTGVGA